MASALLLEVCPDLLDSIDAYNYRTVKTMMKRGRIIDLRSLVFTFVITAPPSTL